MGRGSRAGQGFTPIKGDAPRYSAGHGGQDWEWYYLPVVPVADATGSAM